MNFKLTVMSHMKSLIVGILLYPIALFAQIDDESLPRSFEFSYLQNEKELIQLKSPNTSILIAEDESGDHPGIPNRIGVNLPISTDLMLDGKWIDLPNGERVCRLAIGIEGAKALGLYFSEAVSIPKGGALYVYNYDRTTVLGAFTSENDGFKALQMLPGEELIIEYQEPWKTNKKPIIRLQEVVFFYKDLDFYGIDKDENKAENCQVDASCPEGSPWIPQRRATVFYTFSLNGNTGSCTGTMVNNSANDCKPYVLSANHCGLPQVGSDLSNWVWYWNYEKTICAPNTGNATDPSLPSSTMTGGSVIASAMNGNLDNGLSTPELVGTDFVLIELPQRPPAGFNAFLSGWDRNSSIASSGISLHYPSGSSRKIATIATANNFSLITEIFWSPTSNGFGMMEPGSSGAPLFNSNGLITGVCSFSFPDMCTSSQADYFMKLSASWTSNGAAQEARLQPWLDPTNSGIMTLVGRLNNCSTANLSEIEIEPIQFYPNPASDMVKVKGVNWIEATIYNCSGKELQKHSNSGDGSIPLDRLMNGIYFIRLQLSNGDFENGKIIVE